MLGMMPPPDGCGIPLGSLWCSFLRTIDLSYSCEKHEAGQKHKRNEETNRPLQGQARDEGAPSATPLWTFLNARISTTRMSAC